ncbi:MAG: type II toxin-antitoxin system RelE/ParE family toxin [Planctomycetota bacterium]|nr:type II toxin-antitoxin system RelE/ParE family toxin [Planctomycetaceae bacterium]MDQ3329644.1 type II toxin-antitoxin system RelE/ParE family toxin [Planctomycetota bacterium]
MADVTLTDDAIEGFDRLPVRIKARVATVFDRLAKWPEISGAKPLRGELAGCYRVRTGDYRVQFRVEGDLVIVERIGHRDGFYED